MNKKKKSVNKKHQKTKERLKTLRDLSLKKVKKKIVKQIVKEDASLEQTDLSNNSSDISVLNLINSEKSKIRKISPLRTASNN